MATKDEILIEHVHKELQNGWGPLLGEVTERINGGFYDQHWLDLIVQKFGINKNRTCYDIYDAYVFAQVYSGLHLGKIGLVKIPVGEFPRRDAGVMSNNITLTNIPAPFYAQFMPEKGRAARGDGFLEWDRPIALKRLGYSSVWPLSPGHAPLEVGYTQPCTTLFHLMDDRALARWPYGSKLIYLMKVQDQGLWALDKAHPLPPPGGADA